MFTFTGEKPKWSYDQLEQRRACARQMAASIGTPRNVGEGLAAVGSALAARRINKRADAREAELKEQSQELFSSALEGDRTEQLKAMADPSITPGMRAVIQQQMRYNERQQARGAAASRTASANQRQVDARQAIAQALAGQIAPKPGVQMGPTAEAADAGATSGADLGTLQTERVAPGREQIVQQLIGNPAVSVDQIGDVLDLLPEPEQAPELPAAYQTLEARARAGGLEQGSPEFQEFMLSNGQLQEPQPQTEQVRGADIGLTGELADAFFNRAPDGRIAQIGNAGTNVTLNTGNQGPRLGAIPQGYAAVADPTDPSGFRYEPVANGPAALERQANEAKEQNKQTEERLKLGTTLQSLNLNIAEIENGGLPVTGAFGDFRRTNTGRALTGSSAVDFENRSNQITDAAALAEIQRMRDNSKTGGAVGALTDGERIAIGNAVTALNSSTGADEYLRAAKDYRQLALDYAYGEGFWKIDPETGEVIVRSGQAAPPIGDPKNNPNKKPGLNQIESDLRAQYPDMFEN